MTDEVCCPHHPPPPATPARGLGCLLAALLWAVVFAVAWFVLPGVW